MEALTEAELVRILEEPKNAIVRQYQKLLSMEGVKLTFEKAALKAIAAEAIKRQTGARGLRAIMEQVMEDFMYELPSQKRESVKTLRITAKTVAEKLAKAE